MQKKGNGIDLTNDLLQQLLGLAHEQNKKLSELPEIKQQITDVKEQLQEHSMILRNIAGYIAQDRERQDRAIRDLTRRVEALESKAA